MNNKFLTYFVVAIIVGVLFMLFTGSDEPQAPSLNKSDPQDTRSVEQLTELKTLTSKLVALEEKTNAQQQTIGQLQGELAVQQSVPESSPSSGAMDALAKLKKDIEARLPVKPTPDNHQAAHQTSPPLTPNYSVGGAEQLSQQTEPVSLWIEPMDASLVPVIQENQGMGLDVSSLSVDPTPRFTIPLNTIMTDVTALTGLIGRIPVNGSVTDPFEFKLISKSSAIVANAHFLPADLDYMIWGGIATGDWSLSCIRGTVTSVTFVFTDGTISSYQSDDKKGLGYLTDPYGLPCIKGEKVSNAAPTLMTRVIASGIQAAAAGYAQAQTSTTNTNSGVVYSINDAAKFGGYSALGGGANDMKRWLDQRLGQSFDVIWSAPGQQVSLAINTEIPINYDHMGRKLSHEDISTTSHTHLD